MLELLHKDMVLRPEFAAEGDLRRRRRLELHKLEQRRHALHHLRLQTRKAVPTAWGEPALGEAGEARRPGSPSPPAARAGGVAEPPGSPRGSSHDGVKGLLQQLQDAAPSKLLQGDEMLREVRPVDGASDELAAAARAAPRKGAAAAAAKGGGRRVGSAQPRWRGGTVPMPLSGSPSDGRLAMDRLGHAI